MQSVGFLLVKSPRPSRSKAKPKFLPEFRYVLVYLEDGTFAVKVPGGATVPVSLKKAKKEGAKLSVRDTLPLEARDEINLIWTMA